MSEQQAGYSLTNTALAELFKKAHLETEINSLSNTMGDLYCLQVAMDKNIRDILRCQKLQQRVAVVNAILGCMPLAGGVATHALRRGTARMVAGEAFELNGLVESVFGIGKYWTSSFVTEPAVKRFLRADNIIFGEETWEKIPTDNQLAVGAAADELGLSFEELRSRVRVAAGE